MTKDYIGKHSGYSFDNVCKSVEYMAELHHVASLYDAAALLREQAAELERLRKEPHDECPLWPAENNDK